MVKKLFTALMCALLSLVFVFAACGGNNDNKEEYELELEEGCRQVTIYYNRPSGDYSDCDIWFWYGSVAGRGYILHECAYGAKIVVNVPESTQEVGFIIRTGCAEPGNTVFGNEGKDGTDSDRKIKLNGDYTVIYTKSGNPNNYTSTDGGKTLNIVRFISLADMQDLKHVKIATSDNSTLKADDVKLVNGAGENVTISSFANNTITTAQNMDLSTSYTLKVKDFDDAAVVPLTYFSSSEFEKNYTYNGELGVELNDNSTTFRLWAPTASEVTLNLYNDGATGSAYKTVTMTRGEKGVWTNTQSENLDGKYYTYTVKTSVGTNEAVDPYARSAGLNGNRGMILDLDKTDPDGWVSEPFDNPSVENYTDAQIWEVHIRDFSNKISTSKYKGKYLAFTETDLTNEHGVPVGVNYLKQLGITHVHLLPSFDYASVDESKSDGFNWGYDPQNYNVPEGSYSTNPSDGAVRVKEYKQMVQALHNQGISVVMDVVYNHTYSADSNLTKIVPYYYYRYNEDGTLSSGSGCGNDTASERAMVRKLMVDSVTYWQKEYNLDGFRFDLMGLHDLKTMQDIEKAVHTVNREALIYGEGWTSGGTTIPDTQQAVLANLSKLNNGAVNGIAMFNDVIRDGVRGSVFNIDDTGFATGAKDSYIGKILFGATGGYNNPSLGAAGNGWFADNPTQVVNYVSAHDNNTLWDRICHVYGEGAATLEKRTAMNRLSAAIVQTSLGIPFMQAGEEMLRTKKNADGSYNENSYNSPDSVNNIDWSVLKTDSAQYKTMQYYKGLIEFRKSTETLRLTYAANVKTRKFVCKNVSGSGNGAFIAFTITNLESGEQLLVIYNANESAVNYTLPAGNWDLYVNGTNAGSTVLADDQSGAKQIDALSCYVYKLDKKA